MPLYPINHNPRLPEAIVRAGLEMPELVIVDVGCSGGVAHYWAPYLGSLHAYAVDPLVNEIERLRREDRRPGIHYVDGFVTGPSPPAPRWPDYELWFDRTSSRVAHGRLAIDHTRERHNAGASLHYSAHRFTLDELQRDHAIGRVDFVKSDTDGFDYSVLAGGESMLSTALGVLVEALFAPEKGGAILGDIDCLMRSRGFYLAQLAPQTYTRAALPGAFDEPIMAQTRQGAVSWADCLYLKDVGRRAEHIHTVLRFAMMCELFNLPDIAAEALVQARSEHPQVETLLDALVHYSGDPDAGGYDELMRRFEANPRAFVRGTG